jgi:hypothetical protein
LGLDGPHATSVNLAVTGLATDVTAGLRLLTRRARRARGAHSTRPTRLIRGGLTGPKLLIHQFAVKALLTLI